MKMRLQQAFFNSSQGPQHREFQKEILQAMQVGVWAPTQKLTKSQLTIMCKLAGPQHRSWRKVSLQ
ncbi:nitrogen fixation protein NifR [Staphylococcus aureus]|nr:nitrogen fixation protein NifR [Staphylococcus aureus]